MTTRQLMILAAFWLASQEALPAQTWSRNQQFALPLQPTTGSTLAWGDADRKADHATVAINDARDVLIAYHTSRPDFNLLYPTLKQVEVALLEYNAATDTWSYSQQRQAVVGSVEHSPLQSSYLQFDVKCERPDVIAVGEWFFVVWTRIYEDDYGFTDEPAVLECAWIRKTASGLDVITGNTTSGLGKELDRDTPGSAFEVRDCAGCADAVVLHPGDPVLSIPPTVGVVYPHQTLFPGSGSTDRFFELRFVTCALDPATLALTTVNYPPLVTGSSTTGIPYHGAADAAGIVLPDVAPASVPWRFGLAYEEQPTGPSGPTGRILLETWDVDAPTITLARRESHAFGNLIAVAYRRRPLLSAYPSAFPGEDVFAIAFNRLSSTLEGDVVYEEWNLTDGAFKVLWPVGWGWDNDADHRKPVPLLGRELSLNVWFGRCYAEKSNGGDNCDLHKYVRKDAQTTDQRTTVVTADQLQRPATAYQYDGVHDNVALSWEQLTDWSGLAPFVVRVWLRME